LNSSPRPLSLSIEETGTLSLMIFQYWLPNEC
jgi:hypothetical protein